MARLGPRRPGPCCVTMAGLTLSGHFAACKLLGACRMHECAIGRLYNMNMMEVVMKTFVIMTG
jgi:hypothetical protein